MVVDSFLLTSLTALRDAAAKEGRTALVKTLDVAIRVGTKEAHARDAVGAFPIKSRAVN